MALTTLNTIPTQSNEPFVYVIQELPGTKIGSPKFNIMGAQKYGKLKVLPTPMGQLVQTMLESGVKLGVSSRGSGNVMEDGSGQVSDYEIITVDVVAQPSAPGAYPTPIYEH